jgi:hypothetical protein
MLQYPRSPICRTFGDAKASDDAADFGTDLETEAVKTFWSPGRFASRPQALQAVQPFAGHSNITTTRKYYLAVRPEDIKKAGEFMNHLLSPAKVNRP